MKNLPVPYIFKNFNVNPSYTNKGFRTGINILVDPLVEALNTNHQLPKYILVTPDKDLLPHVKWGNGVSVEIGAALHYVIKQHDIQVKRRRQSLMQKKPGAVLQDEFPKIVWVRMLKQLQNLIYNGVFNLRGRHLRR